jgi:hypothetical protein
MTIRPFLLPALALAALTALLAAPAIAAAPPDQLHPRRQPQVFTGRPVPGLSEGIVEAAAPTGPLTLSADKREIAPGDTVTITAVFTWPATSAAESGDIWFIFTPNSPLTIVSTSGPASIVLNPGEGHVGGVTGAIVCTSNQPILKLSGQTQTYPPVNGQAQVPMGDFLPGESDFATIVAKW